MQDVSSRHFPAGNLTQARPGCLPRISKVFSLWREMLFRHQRRNPIAWPMSYSLPQIPQTPAHRVNPGWADALFRDVECGMGSWRDVDIDEASFDAMMPSMPSLHDRLMDSRGKRSTPPLALWTGNPFGDDAA